MRNFCTFLGLGLLGLSTVVAVDTRCGVEKLVIRGARDFVLAGHVLGPYHAGGLCLDLQGLVFTLMLILVVVVVLLIVSGLLGMIMLLRLLGVKVKPLNDLLRVDFHSHCFELYR